MDLTATVATVMTLGSSSALFTRYVVALLHLGVDLPAWLPGALALGIGTLAAGLLMTIQHASLDGPNLATVILAGVVAAAESEGLAVVQDQAHRARVRRQMQRFPRTGL